MPTPDIQRVLMIAKEAGSAILDQLHQGVEVQQKNDDSPVTAADKYADAIIKQGLRALDPSIPILSEEDTPEERKAAAGSTRKWIIDPLDGTKTAIGYAEGHKGYVQFGVHIALVENGAPVLGVAFFPAMAEEKGVAYFTGNNGRAYKQTGEAVPRPIGVSRVAHIGKDLCAAVHFHPERRPVQIAGKPYRAIPGVGGQRLCLVAEGAVDVADMNDIAANHVGTYSYKQWDLAAAHAILKAAGGELVSAEDKQPVRYDRLDFTVPGAYAGSTDVLKFLNLSEQNLRQGRHR